MHVLHLGKYYAPYRGGMETILQEMAEGLLDEGCDVTLVTSATGVHALTETIRGPHTGRGGRLLRVARLGLVNSQPVNPGLVSALRRELARGGADLLHLHLPNPLAAAACLALRRDPSARRVPLAVWYHADITRQRLGARMVTPIVRACLREAAGICVSSAALRDHSPVLAPFRAKVTVVPFGIAPAPWRSVEPRPDGPFVFVGRLVGYKGVDVLLQALADVPGAQLEIVGDGPLAPGLRDEAVRLGLGGRVAFLGEMDGAGIAGRLARARALVLPSVDRSEAFGLVQLEAMAAGVAVICTDLPTGVAEVGVPHRTCLRVPPGDPAALGGALATLLADGELAGRLGRAGRARYDELFTREAMVGRLLDWYGTVAASAADRRD
ncbi:MAG: glycosyltransferase [bacterium]|nr:glycosyltransferase [bacterium]